MLRREAVRGNVPRTIDVSALCLRHISAPWHFALRIALGLRDVKSQFFLPRREFTTVQRVIWEDMFWSKLSASSHSNKVKPDIDAVFALGCVLLVLVFGMEVEVRV